MTYLSHGAPFCASVYDGEQPVGYNEGADGERMIYFQGETLWLKTR
jgi:hypothetical protein